MNDLVGKSLGRYHILEQLGKGGMAIVYRAYDTHLDCEVAVKVIQTDQILPAALERTRKRFEHEAKDVARLVHPNIVRVMDYGEENGVPYLVMPLISGGTLSQYLAKIGRMDWMEAASLLLPIANALGHAHQKRIIHRDVKPSNILLTPDRVPLLTDFGVAKVLDEEGTMDLTGTNATVGTPEYMAPEQIVSKTVDHRADIYALGVVYYEMVTGMRPFIGVTPMETLFKHASDPLPPPTRINPDIPQRVEDFLLKALMKKPDERFSSMPVMEKALRAIINDSPLFWKTESTVPVVDELETVDDKYDTIYQDSSRETDRSAPSFEPVKPATSQEPHLPQAPVYQTRKSLLPWIILGVFAVVGVIAFLLLTSTRGAPFSSSTGSNYESSVSEPDQDGNSSSISSVLTQASANEVSTPKPVDDTNDNTPLIVVVTNTPMTQTRTPTPVVCPGMKPSRVKVGDKVEVCTIYHLILRKTPEADGTFVRNLNKGDILEIIGEHVCEDESIWWEVFYEKADVEGWVREGSDEILDYFICPINED